jgi:multidrug efflux pump
MSKFFIDRPVFAWVIALMIVLVGLISIRQLPIARYPNIAPPSISITATYPGASAKSLEDSVTSVIEQNMNGLDNLMYMSSTSESSGMSTITLTFEPGTDPNIAQVQVQNKLKTVEARLPSEVTQQGLLIDKATRNYLLFIAVSSPDSSIDEVGLGNFVTTHVLDSMRRIPGVGSADLFGAEYAMRIWLHPDQLLSYNLMPSDVIAAIRAQNVQVTAGELGGLPSAAGQELNATVVAQSRLTSAEQFGNILLRVNANGSAVHLRDVARVQLGASDYTLKSRYNGKPAALIGVKLTPTANALATAGAIHARLKEISKDFPPNIRADIPYDTSDFIKISVEDVVKTLSEAILLVFLVMYLFLQNWRATFIPSIVVPVALLGTFSVMSAFGFSINVLTLFGMVLAIGLLVDDAIVVIENVERIMSEEGLSPRDATRKAMGQITNALIGITLVLTAVFIPMAFFGGAVGAIYRQFSMALVGAMLFSIVLALTLTPALCATFLKPVEAGHHLEKRGFFGWFNRSFDATRGGYQSVVARLLKRSFTMMLVFAGVLGLVVYLFIHLPTSFLPDEDQGYFITMIQLPTGATQQRTLKVLEQVEAHYLKDPGVGQVVDIAGFSFAGRGQNGAVAFARLKPWDERRRPDLSVDAIIGRAFGAFMGIKEAFIYPFNAPAIPELGTATGFDLQLQDRAGLGHAALMQARNQLLGMASQSKVVMGVRPNGQEDTPQFQLDIDRDKAGALGLSLADVNATLSTFLGSAYVNDFTNGTRVQHVVVQADAPDRMLPNDILKLYVRNNKGDMVPFWSFASTRWSFGSPRLEHYNGIPSVEVQGMASPGRSSGEAMAEMENLVKQLPPGIGFEWTGQSYQERLSGSQAPALFAISIVVVFLCLAALYESWSIPFAVMLVVPLGVLGAVLAAKMRGLPDDVYFKVGLLAIIGLSTKNAILIIEFAKDLQAQGKGLMEATLEAVHLRLRPILMTSIAFIFGVMPLAVSTGAGSGSQHAIGTGVVGGMISATILAVFFVPIFFVVVRSFFKGNERQRRLDAHKLEYHDDEKD